MEAIAKMSTGPIRQRRINLGGGRHDLNQLASAFPVACRGVSERTQFGKIPYWEGSAQLAAGRLQSSK